MILASQIALKRSQNNETELQTALAKYFKIIETAIQSTLEEYWSDTLLLQGHLDLILQPLTDGEEAYYQILEQYIKREYKLGISEAKRLVELAVNPQANKSIFDKLKKKVNIKATRNNLFGTLTDAEQELLERTNIFSKKTLARITTDINQILTKGYTDGKGINVVATTITKRFNQLETWEARRIARTEIHNAHNNAVMKTYDTLGVEYTQWIAADDDRTRESHI